MTVLRILYFHPAQSECYSLNNITYTTMGSSVMVARMQKELLMLAQSPPPGVSAWAVDGKINMLEAGVYK